MSEEGGKDEVVVVRASTPDDLAFAEPAARLIELVADRYDIATRTPEWLAAKIEKGRAALAYVANDETDRTGELVGFGYWSAWQNDTFVSHSGLVVHPDRMGTGLGRRLKRVLFDSTRAQLPHATMMSLTTSPQVKRMNLSLGFEVVPLDQLAEDPAFWEGCKTCRNYAEVQARGEKCCCEGMILRPPGAPDSPGGPGAPGSPGAPEASR